MKILGYEIDHAFEDEKGRIQSTRNKGRSGQIADIHYNNSLRRLVIFHEELREEGLREEKMSKQVLTDLWMRRWDQTRKTASNYIEALYQIRT